MSVTLLCIICQRELITLHQSAGGIIPWIAMCKECWETVSKKL